MTKKIKHPSAKNAAQLTGILGLDPEETIQMEFRVQLNVKIVSVVKKRGLTHEEVAALAKASRTRITAVLNGNTSGISTDLLLRILYSLGYRIKASFSQRRLAA